MRRAALLLLALAVTTADASAPTVWERALDRDAEAARERYQAALADGDELVLRANARGLSRSATIQLVDQALAAYRRAAEAAPAEGEPYFRIATVLENFFTDCEQATPLSPSTCPPRGAPINITRARAVVDAYVAFEQRAPLDPRVTDFLFQRALVRTKLVDGAADPRPLLEGALADYRAMLDRAGGMHDVQLHSVWGNLAETYMMLGQLDEAIDHYKIAMRTSGGSATAYGLAVALDRDGAGAEALRVARAYPLDEFRRFQYQFAEGQVFYVPRGEEYYYFALVYEAHGLVAEAIANWRLFLQSGAQPRYQARARERLDALLKQRPAPRKLPSPLELELFP